MYSQSHAIRALYDEVTSNMSKLTKENGENIDK